MEKEIIEQIAKKTAEETIKEYLKQSKKTNRGKNFRNTRRLMENYQSIKNCVEQGISEISELKIDISEELDEDELFIASIRRSKFRSAIMLAQIDKGIELLRRQQELRNELEKFYVFNYIFMDGMTYESAAEVYDCSVITARRWVNSMLDSLSSFIFGIDGIYME